MDHPTHNPLVPPGQCPPCPDCGAARFPDPDTGEALCPACVRFAPADDADGGDQEPEPPKSTRDRDAAFEKVKTLLKWWAVRYLRWERAGHGTTAEEFVAEATVCFCANWHNYDGNPHHLTTFAMWAARRAAQNLRRQNRPPLGVSLDAFDNPADLAPAPEPRPGPEPELLARLRQAVAALAPRRRDEVERFYGLNGRRRVTQREIARTRGHTSRSAAGARVKVALAMIAAAMAKGGAPC